MLKWIIAYVAAAVAFGVLDAIWLRWAAGNLYRPVIGEIMAKDFNVAAAGAFYVIYVAGMTWFAIKPGIEAGAVQPALLNGILLGALCYATFDLTSHRNFSQKCHTYPKSKTKTFSKLEDCVSPKQKL